jgi:hypothetical protein
VSVSGRWAALFRGVNLAGLNLDLISWDLVRCVQNTAFFKIKIDFYFINT